MGKRLFEAFRIIFKNAKIYLIFVLIMIGVTIGLIGLPNSFDESKIVLMLLMFVMVWLTSIYYTRQIYAKHKVRVRDGIFNAPQPMVSTVVLLMVATVQCLPIAILIVAYSSAIETNFLATTGYAIMFLIFAIAMIMLSMALVTPTIIALVATTAPGLYPIEALKTANDLVSGQRMRVIVNIVVGTVVAAVMCVAVVWPISLVAPPQVVAGVTAAVGCFATMYLAVYLYVYYRRLLK